jgi:O-antigen ligase
MPRSKFTRVLFPLFCLCLFTLSLGQFSVIYSFNNGNIYLFDFLIALFDFLGTIFLLSTGKLGKIPPSILMLLAFCALGLASLVFTPLNLELTEFVVSASYLTRFFSYVLFALITWNLIGLKIFQVDRIQRAIVFTGMFLFIAGLLQLVVLPDLENLSQAYGWDPHKNRMVSTFLDPNFLGMYFVICLAWSLRVKTTTKNSVWINYLSISLLLVGILLTFSRSAWLATAVLLFFTLLRKRGLMLVSLAIVLLAVFAVPNVQTRISGITDPQDSASFRLISWKNTWEIAKENWVFGVGYNTFRYAQREYGFLDDSGEIARSGAGSDSSLLLVLATTGIFGLVCFVGFFVLALLSAIKRVDLVTLGLILALLIDSLFINSLFYPQITVGILLYMVAAKGFEPLTSAM